MIISLVAAGVEVEIADGGRTGGLEVDDVQEGVTGDWLPGAIAAADAEEGARCVQPNFSDVLRCDS